MKRANKLNTVILATLLLTACGGGGGGDPQPPSNNPESGEITEAELTPLAQSFFTTFFGLLELQSYATFNYMFEFMSDNPTDSGPQTCLDGGTFTQTLDGSGSLTDASFSNCFSAVSAPINGSYHHNLIEVVAQFAPGDVLFPTDITKWHTQFDFDHLTRTDPGSGNNFSVDGFFEFDFEDVPVGNFAGWRTNVTTENLSYSDGTGSVFLQDLVIDYTYVESTDRLSIDLSGNIVHTNVGPIEVSSNLLSFEEFQSANPRLTGSIELRATISVLTITFDGLNNYLFELDEDGNGVVDLIVDSNSTTGPTTPFEGTWSSVQENGNGSLDGVFEFLGNDLFIVDQFGSDLFDGTFTDTSVSTQSRLEYTIINSFVPAYAGTIMLCAYELDATGISMRIACNEPGVPTYPPEVTPTADVAVWGLTLNQ